MNAHILIVMMACMTIVTAAVDMYLPALPTMVNVFHTSGDVIQYSMVLNVLAAATSGFFYGILSDSHGRKKLLIFGLSIVIITTLMGAFSENVFEFNLSRLLQGLGSGAIYVLIPSIIADSYKGLQKAKIFGLFGILFPISLGIAPFIGEQLLAFYGWKSSFYFIAIFLIAVMLYLMIHLPETKNIKEHRSLKKAVLEAVNIGKNLPVLVYALIPSLYMGAYMAFISNSPFIYMDYFGLSPEIYVYYFTAPLGVQILSAFVYQLLIFRIGTQKSFILGISASAISVSLILLFSTNTILITPLFMSISMCLYNFGISFILPISMTWSMETFPNRAGTISSVISIVRNISISSAVGCAAFFFNSSPYPTLTTMIVFFCLFLLIAYKALQLQSSQALVAK